MRRPFLLTAALLALAAVGAFAAPIAPSAIRVPQTQIDAVNARWKSFGVTLPPGGIILAHPYAPPYSNRSFVVPFAWYAPYYAANKKHREYPVSAAALRADLPVLRFLMEKTYAGYAPAADRGWNWNAWFTRWSASLARLGTKRIPLTRAFAPWGAYERFQLDNHSGVPGLMQFVSGSRSAQLASPPRAACARLQTSEGTFALRAGDAGQQPHKVLTWSGSSLTPAWYLSYPRRDGTARALRCGAERIALNPLPDGMHDAGALHLSEKPSYTDLGDGIALIRMPTFSDANDVALSDVLSKAPGIGRERAVIFDLRGNGGGNAPTDLLNTWFAQSNIENAADLTQSGTQSCFRTALFFGLQQQLAHGLKAGETQYSQAMQAIADTLKGPSNCAVIPNDHQGTGSLRDHDFTVKPQHPQQTRVIALVDNGCGSDCEYLVSILAQLPDTVIAGSSTYGVMGFTQPGYFVLPNSRVPFRLALSRTDAYGDGRSVDGYGISVDVLLPTIASQNRTSLLALAKALE